MNKLLWRGAAVASLALLPLLAQSQTLPPPGGPGGDTGGPINHVPEPGSLALAGLALGASVALRVRRARRAAAQAVTHD